MVPAIIPHQPVAPSKYASRSMASTMLGHRPLAPADLGRCQCPTEADRPQTGGQVVGQTTEVFGLGGPLVGEATELLDGAGHGASTHPFTARMTWWIELCRHLS